MRWAGIRCVSTIPQVLRYIGNECAYVPVCESLFRLARLGWSPLSAPSSKAERHGKLRVIPALSHRTPSRSKFPNKGLVRS